MSIVVNARPHVCTAAEVGFTDAGFTEACPDAGRGEHLRMQGPVRATAAKPANGNKSGRWGRSSECPLSPASLPVPPAVSIPLPDPAMPDGDAQPRLGSTSSATRVRTFEDAILPHLDSAYNLARWLTRDPVAAEDIVQDACARALQYFGSFRGDNGRAWLLGIVRNVAYSRLRNRRADGEVALAGAGGEGSDDEGGFGMEIADPDPGPEAAMAITQDLALLKAAVLALPIDLRQCLVLRDMEELSYKQIARIVNVPVGTVMSRLCRARRMLMASRAACPPGAPS